MTHRRVYCRLRAQLALTGVSAPALAKKLGISYETLRVKMTGARAFSLDEALLIKRLLGYEGTVETLFEKTDALRVGQIES